MLFLLYTERVLYRNSSCWPHHLQGTGHALAGVTVSAVLQLKDSDSLNMGLNTSKHHTTCKFLDPTPDQNISGGTHESEVWFLQLAVLTVWEIALWRGCRSSKKSVPACHSYSSWAALASPCIPTAVLQAPSSHTGGLNHQQSLRSRAVLRRLPSLSATRLPATHKWTETRQLLFPLLHFFFFSIL